MDLTELARQYTRHLVEKLECLNTLERLTEHDDCNETYAALGVHLQYMKSIESQVRRRFPQLVSPDLLPYWSPDVLGWETHYLDENGEADLGLTGGALISRKRIKFQGAFMACSDRYFCMFMQGGQMVVRDKFTGDVVLAVNSFAVAIHGDRAVFLADQNSLEIWHLKPEQAVLLHHLELKEAFRVRDLCFDGSRIAFLLGDEVHLFDDQLNLLETYALDKGPDCLDKMDLYEGHLIWHMRSEKQQYLVMGDQPVSGKIVAQGGFYNLWQGCVYEERRMLVEST